LRTTDSSSPKCVVQRTTGDLPLANSSFCWNRPLFLIEIAEMTTLRPMVRRYSMAFCPFVVP